MKPSNLLFTIICIILFIKQFYNHSSFVLLITNQHVTAVICEAPLCFSNDLVSDYLLQQVNQEQE